MRRFSGAPERSALATGVAAIGETSPGRVCNQIPPASEYIAARYRADLELTPAVTHCAYRRSPIAVERVRHHQAQVAQHEGEIRDRTH